MDKNTDNDFDFFITSMPSTRPADYYLGCLDGSVFIDFNNCGNNLVCLKRISFDGYGCCTIENETQPMNEIDSAEFKRIVLSEEINQERLTQIIKKTISDNKDLILENALKEYKLI